MKAAAFRCAGSKGTATGRLKPLLYRRQSSERARSPSGSAARAFSPASPPSARRYGDAERPAGRRLAANSSGGRS